MATEMKWKAAKVPFVYFNFLAAFAIIFCRLFSIVNSNSFHFTLGGGMGEGQAGASAKDVTDEMEESGQIEGLLDEEQEPPQGESGSNEKPIDVDDVGVIHNQLLSLSYFTYYFATHSSL